jgi:hypothetical protein
MLAVMSMRVFAVASNYLLEVTVSDGVYNNSAKKTGLLVPMSCL